GTSTANETASPTISSPNRMNSATIGSITTATASFNRNRRRKNGNRRIPKRRPNARRTGRNSNQNTVPSYALFTCRGLQKFRGMKLVGRTVRVGGFEIFHRTVGNGFVEALDDH